MHFDSGTALIKSTNCGISMRKAIALVLLLALGTMPLQTSAQVSVPAVDLQCSHSADLDKQIEELQQKKNEMIAQEDVTEQMFNDD